MNNKIILRRFSVFVFFIGYTIAVSTYVSGSVDETKTQEDTVYINNVSSSPVFDGIGNDECWVHATWQVIDQVWIPYGDELDSTDLYGRYKVVWSSATNLLYFLLEINDDVISDAYVPNQTAAIYNFDMFEVFIDENKSGGYHVFDGNADNEQSLGLNAENAFAYHIFTSAPESGSTNEEFIVEDMAGTSWGDAVTCDYTIHFPDFIRRQDENIATWEFSLMVYDDTYSSDNIEGSRVTLTPGKIMGLSLAINDDDEPQVNPSATERDNFMGSVAVTAEAYNDHWKNANDFGAVKLVSDFLVNGVPSLEQSLQEQLNLYPNPSSNSIFVEFNNDYLGELTMTLCDLQGREILKFNRNKVENLFCENFDLQIPGGFYILQIRYGNTLFSEKIDLLR